MKKRGESLLSPMSSVSPVGVCACERSGTISERAGNFGSLVVTGDIDDTTGALPSDVFKSDWHRIDQNQYFSVLYRYTVRYW
jgi:hypothetical protein